MAFYAQFDPATESPQAIIGWYDTGVFQYPHLPPPNALVVVNGVDWLKHFNQPHGWTVSNGRLIAPSA